MSADEPNTTASPNRGERAATDGGESTGPTFETVTLPGHTSTRPSVRTIGFVVSLVVVTALYCYHQFVLTGYKPVVGNWYPKPHEWLFIIAWLVLVFYVIVPLVRHRQVTRGYLDQFRKSVPASASLVYVVAFVVVGTFGPIVLGRPHASINALYQPPVFEHVSIDTSLTCVGQVNHGQCYGTWRYPLGTDSTGRGIAKLVVAGARVSLEMGLVASTLMIPIATIVGVTAGYLRGWPDTVLMRYVDIQQTVPAILVYLMANFIYGKHFATLLIIFGLLNWGGIARVVRNEIIQRRSENYVLAARSAGSSDLAIVRHHLLPNIASTLLTAATRQIPMLILTEAALSYLQLTDINVPSFGVSISMGIQRTVIFDPTHVSLGAWWVTIVPVVVLSLTVVAFSLFGDTLREASNPLTES